MKLSLDNLQAISFKGQVSIPLYDRSKIIPGILHIGVGNFHRAHLASYIDDWMEQDFDQAKEYGIIGASILSCDENKRNILQSQNWYQTIVEQDNNNVMKPRIVGCMIDYLEINMSIIAKQLQNPTIKIVSLTITEGGYYLSNGKFDRSNPDIQYDILNPNTPKTIFGLLCQGARYRKDNGLLPFTILSCDNIPHNGTVTRNVTIGIAKAQDENFGIWMNNNIAFPNSMVDRITPVTTQEQKDLIMTKYGYQDMFPVFCEPFRQWVLEDTTVKETGGGGGCFPLGLDQLDNVKFVPDVAPYEFMKIRILNGGHASLCYPAALLDIDYVHESIQHDTISSFLDALEHTEIIPTIPPVPDTVLVDYWKDIVYRFSNPSLKDTISRICFDGSGRQPKFIIPTIQDNLLLHHHHSNTTSSGRQQQSVVDGLALVSAMWCRYCEGVTESGKEIIANDPQWDKLHKLACQVKIENKPKLWLQELSQVYGTTKDSLVFEQAFIYAWNQVQTNGVVVAMQHYVSTHPK